MNFQPVTIALLISAFSLLVSLVNLIANRRDKSVERTEKAVKEQKDALTLVDTTVHRRIDDLTKETASWQAQNTIRLTAIETSQATADERLKHMLDRRDLDVLQRSIADVANSVSRLGGQLETNTRLTERMNSFLMERSPHGHG